MLLRIATVTLALLVLLAPSALAEKAAPRRGDVTLSVERFEELLEAAREKPIVDPDPEEDPPLRAVLESLRLNVNVNEHTNHADVGAEMTVSVLSEDWVEVPLLASTVAISRIVVDGKESAVDEKEGKYVLHLKGRGKHPVAIFYQAPIETLRGGHRLQLPMPRVASGELRASLPGVGWEVHVLPTSGLELRSSGGKTEVSAALRRGDNIQILWGSRGDAGHVFTRAAHVLEVVGEGVFVEADYEIEISSDEARDVPLVSAAYSLQEVLVGGKPARVTLQGAHHAVTLQGHGVRRVQARFALNVDRSSGQPAIDMSLPVVPISRFELQIPGKRDVSVEPQVPLRIVAEESVTKVSAHLPKSSHVRFGWTDSRPVPEQNVRMNAEGWYVVAAEQGGLRISARFDFDVISGKAGQILFTLPENVVIYQVTGDGITDWRTSTDSEAGGRVLSVYFDEARHGRYGLEVSYDSLLRTDGSASADGLSIPVIQPSPIHRYQGVVLLLAGEELEFEPLKTDGFSQIGEESLPQTVRSGLPAKVAHGFKYVGEAPELTVKLQSPQREVAKFDVRTNTLLTLDEGALRGQASADVMIKSGTLKELVFEVDAAMDVLDVVAPALLKFTEVEVGDKRVVTVAFTEELEGSIRVGLSFESILGEQTSRLEPTPIEVRGADVQRGFLALESAAAVEVVGMPGDSIHPIGVDELPRALSGGSANPILLAYKYSHLPYVLAIEVTQHEALETIDSRILSAEIVTQFKRQGNLVTSVAYQVQNQSRQFLRVDLDLPADGELWEVVVDGRTVRPARDDQGLLIVPLPRSETSFPVRLTYATKQPEMGYYGDVELEAPRPDVFVGALRWSVTLPAGFRYREVESNLDSQRGVPHGGVPFTMQRDLIAPTDEPPMMAVPYSVAFQGKGPLIFACLLGLTLAVLLLRRGESAGRFEKALTLGLAAGGLGFVVLLQVSPWTLLLPILVGGVGRTLFARGQQPSEAA